jgi:hypothetical protein
VERPLHRLVLTVARGLRHAGRARQEEAVGGRRGGQLLDPEARARARDDARLQLSGAAPLAHDQVAKEALLGAPVPGREALRAAPGLHGLAQLVHPLGGQDVERDVVDRVEAAGAVEAEHQLAVLVLAERVLELVAIAKLLHGGHDRLDRRVLEAADAGQGVAHLVLLLTQLQLVGEHLPRRAWVRRHGLDAVRRGLEQLDGVRLREGALRLAHPGPHAVARHGAAHEHDVAVHARDAGAAVGEPVDRELELVAAARAAALGGGHRPSSLGGSTGLASRAPGEQSRPVKGG